MYLQTLTPNDWYKGKSLITEMKFENIEADNKEEAEQKGKEKIEKYNFKDEKGFTENKFISVQIIK